MGTSAEGPAHGSATGDEPSALPRFAADLMGELVDRAGEILTAQDGLRALLTANRSVVEELSLPAVLRRVVAAAQTVAGARYAALGVIGPDGLLEEFVHTGMTPDEVAQIGDLPRGRGSWVL